MASPAPTAAYKDALLALQAQQRARLSVLVQQTEAMLHSDWARGMGAAASLYRPVLDEYAKALSALRIANDDPAARLSLDWLTSQNSALKEIEQSVRASALTYGNASVKTVEDAQLKAMNAGLQDAENLTQEALFPASQLGVNPAMLFNRPNPDAISQFVGRAGNGNPLGDLFANFPQEATSAARQALLMGLATGANPVSMAQGISQALGISRSRAITIARTEVLGSYRQAAHETYRANSDVLQGWIWSAGGANPCAMCAGMDGTLHDLSEDLSDHPCGKCAPIPVTKPWSDILGPYGIDASGLDETSIGAPGNYTSISEKFSSYSPAKQREIIGTQTGYEAYKRGELTLKDFIGVRPAADGFPSSYYQKSLKELQIPTRQAKRLVEFNPELAQKFALGKLRYSELGQPVPEELMPAWAKRSDASRIVYQILRNGLPYDMESHERGLLITNLAEMLRTDLPVSERAAVERQLQALGGQVERLTLKGTKLAEVGAEREAIQGGKSIADLVDMHAPAADMPRVVDEANARIAARLADNLAWQDYLTRSGLTPQEAAEQFGGVFRGTLNVNERSGAGAGAMMRAVRDEFGLTKASLGYVEQFESAAELYAEEGPALRAYVRAAYEETQQYLRENGITEVTLYRGGPIIETEKPFVSYSVDREYAAIYAQAEDYPGIPADQIMLREVTLPADQILGLPQTGIGNQLEGEVVALGQRPAQIATERDALAGARAEVRDAQRALRAAEDAVRADYSRSPQGLLGNRLLDDPRIVSAQARLEAAQARVQELRQTAKVVPTVETAATRSAETALAQAAAAKTASQESLDALSAAQARLDVLRAQSTTASASEIESTLLDVAKAQAQVDAEMGGRGAIILIKSEENALGAADDLAKQTEAMFGHALTRDELGGLVGAPQGGYVEITSTGNDALAIELKGPSYDPLNPRSLGDSPFEIERRLEYSATRYMFTNLDGDLVMDNDRFVVGDAFKSQGMGSAIFADEVQSLSNLGVKYIVTEAGGDGATLAANPQALNGFYTWPRLGYNGKLEHEALQAIKDAVERGELPKSYGSFSTIQQLMRTPQGRAWWKLNGKEMRLKFNLAPNSLSMRVLKAYLQAKGLL